MTDAPVMASLKLTAPKTAPKTAPAVGPSRMAPTAMGTVKNDMYSGPTGTLPSPTAFIASSMAMSIAISTM